LAKAAPIRLLAADIDGTLLDTQAQLPPRNREALVAAREAGVEVVLVTGRRFTFALPIARLLPFELVMITTNGAVIKSTSGQSYYRRLLAVDTAARTLELTRAYRDYTVLAYDVERQGQLVLEGAGKRTPGFQAWLERNREFATFAPLEQALARRAPERPLEVMFNGPVGILREVESLLLGAPFAGQFRLFKTEYETRDLSIMDVIHPHCSKGSALKIWAERRGLSRAEVMAVGDNFNDREMLEFAGLAVVMGNAVEGLLVDGWKTTGHCDQAGLADAIDAWVLRGRKPAGG
jgi:hypothetical protein